VVAQVFGDPPSTQKRHVMGPRNPVTKTETRAIVRDWILHDEQAKRENKASQKNRIQSRKAKRDKTEMVHPRPQTARVAARSHRNPGYSPQVGFAKAKCYDPAPYNETGFPMSPRPMSGAPSIRTHFANRRQFACPDNLPNENQAGCGLGGHEEEAHASKRELGFCDTASSLPFINFQHPLAHLKLGTKLRVNYSTAMLQPPRFVQTERWPSSTEFNPSRAFCS